MMTSGWVVRTYRFFDDKRWLILSSAFSKLEKKLCLFVLFLWLKMKKTFPFCFKKTTTSFFTFCPFLVSPKMKKTSFPFALNKKKACQQLSLFVCSFFASPNDDNWWQVGRWYGIPNLVMTWWLRWVVVTKLSKCWWHHIEMVPKGPFQYDITSLRRPPFGTAAPTGFSWVF